MLSRLYATLIFLCKDSYFQLTNKFRTDFFRPDAHCIVFFVFSMSCMTDEYKYEERIKNKDEKLPEIPIKKQGCKVVVIDLDEHVHHLDSFALSKYISRRKEDFTSGMITDCYVVFCGKAVRVNARYQTRIEIEHKIETLRP